ncbi:MAG: DNA-binding protein [Gammaproteobacteria bacterium]|nr:MAG: DNA-binding protein [Gammaproteobacteria bacterium]
MNIQPIKNEENYDLALARVGELMNAVPDTPEGDELDVLVTLIEAYEEKNYPIDAPNPIEAIHFRMEQDGLSNKDLVEYLGSTGRVSEVLNYKRSLSITMIRRLNSGLKIPLESLFNEYQLRA